MTWVVVPAAGRGLRAGAVIPKQYRPICGRPLIEHSLRALASHPAIEGMVVVLAAHDEHWPGWTSIQGRPLITASGGAQRADSVLAGLDALPVTVAEHTSVLVHDAARPCIRRADIAALLEHEDENGALLAVPLADTLKRADGVGRVIDTVPREGLWRAVTPQFFRRGLLTRALRAAAAAGVLVTDEAMAMERIGYSPQLVEGSADNLKVTTAQDFALAEFLLRQQAAGESV